MEIKYLQVLVMPQGEIIHCGKTIGWADSIDKDSRTKTLLTQKEVAEQQ